MPKTESEAKAGDWGVTAEGKWYKVRSKNGRLDKNPNVIGEQNYNHYHQFPLRPGRGRPGRLQAADAVAPSLYGANAELAGALRDAIAAGTPSAACGVAFDGFPIHGPLIEKDGEVVFAKSSYTGAAGHLGHPTFVAGSGDLDVCNGLMTPAGYRYVLTCELNGDAPCPPTLLRSRPTAASPSSLNYPERARQPSGVKDFIKQNEEGKVTKDACALM
ncbi:hypothetical protein SO694_00088164 [Aureococcus anophagefferens]|uniref:YHYH domain-containing protein n=1 Tax=Aureococcus anophagefferens TaxID=44056 RepID=A0ABR1G4D0_AURAN